MEVTTWLDGTGMDGGTTESDAFWLGELLPSRSGSTGASGYRQSHSIPAAPVAVTETQGEEQEIYVSLV